jgi:aspartyl-tRNA(Asn)/glutamyl-tRNA(Gln) amidotransferase subunit C
VIDRSDVLHIARLARLHIEESEVEDFRRELSGILEHIERISELDLAGVEPTAHSVSQIGTLRPDQPGESFSRDVALSAAPETDGVGFQVPAP